MRKYRRFFAFTAVFSLLTAGLSFADELRVGVFIQSDTSLEVFNRALSYYLEISDISTAVQFDTTVDLDQFRLAKCGQNYAQATPSFCDSIIHDATLTPGVGQPLGKPEKIQNSPLAIQNLEAQLPIHTKVH